MQEAREYIKEGSFQIEGSKKNQEINIRTRIVIRKKEREQ